MGRIPSAMALKSRGIHIGSDVCGYCNEAVEDSDHILVRCHVASITRKWIYSSAGLVIVTLLNRVNFSILLPPGDIAPKKETIYGHLL